MPAVPDDEYLIRLGTQPGRTFSGMDGQVSPAGA
jgi:hypothetical protein